MNDKLFFETEKMEWEELGGGVSRQIMGYDEKIMLLKVKFDKGAIGKPHQHFHSQTSYVAGGSFQVTIDGQKQLLQSGDTFYVPANAVHGVVCLEGGILVDVFSPLREDFLTGGKVSYFGNK